MNISRDISYDSENEDIDYDDNEEVKSSNEDQTIEIEIREFQDLGKKRDINEYCKPYKNDFFVIDSDDICRLAVFVSKRLLEERPEEFSLSMLQAISDVRENIE